MQELNEQAVPDSLDARIEELANEVETLDGAIDSQYCRVLSNRETASEDGTAISIDSAAAMQQLSRDQPEVLPHLLNLASASTTITAGLHVHHFMTILYMMAKLLQDAMYSYFSSCR